MSATSLPPETIEAITPDQLRAARAWGGLLSALAAGSLAGVASSLYLVNHYPLALIALSPLGRHLVLVAPIVDPVAFLVVAMSRRMVFYLGCFGFGRALGPAGIVWVEARARRFGRFVRFAESLFERWSYALVLAFPGPVAGLAGISGMRMWLFALLAVPGLAVRLIIVLGFAEWLREPLEWLLAQIDEWWRPGTVVLVIALALRHLYARRQAAASR